MSKTGRNILVLHESGAPSHYRGMRAAAQANGYSVEFAEFSFARKLAKAVLRRDGKLFRRVLRNLFLVVPLLLGARWDGPVVVGMAPFNVAMLWFRLLMRNNAVSLHCSWPHWDLSKAPHGLRCTAAHRAWRATIRAHVRRIFFVTESARESFATSSFAPAATSIVYHSFDGSVFCPAGEARDGAVLTVGFVGRLEASKGVRDVLALAGREYGFPVRFLFAGDGSLADELVAAASADPRVEYVGHLAHQEDLAEFYRSLDVLLLPSRRTPTWEEAFGMVIIEAMACGAYPVATGHPGPREIFARAGVGSALDEDAFVGEAYRLLNQFPRDPEARQRLRRRASEAAREYAIEAVAARWGALFEDHLAALAVEKEAAPEVLRCRGAAQR